MLSLSTSRLGVTFLCPSVGGNLLFVHGFLFLGKATLFAQGLGEILRILFISQNVWEKD